jgi:hypothetical protein
MSEFYLVKDAQRIVSLAAEREGKLYAFVPNVRSFVYNKPMSVDFQIDREMNYEPVSTDTAASIVRDGSIGEIDESTNKFLLDHMKAETRRINPEEILDGNTHAGTELPLAQVANVVADILRSAPFGRWITYMTYPRLARRIALQLASDLRDGLVPAFSDIPLVSRVRDNTDDTQIVEVRRTRGATAARSARTAPRKAAAKVAAKKTGDKVPVKAARRTRAAAATKTNVHSRAKSR